MREHGFLRIATAVPVLRTADPLGNVAAHLDSLCKSEAEGVEVVCFPELSLTGYTCNDLFHQQILLEEAKAALLRLTEEATPLFHGLFVVGLPLLVDEQVFNCAAIVENGRIRAIVPKTYLPTYKEFYDARYFAPAATAHSSTISLGSETIPFGTDVLLSVSDVDGLVIGVEICEDLWMPIPPSCLQALHGATVLLNLSASNETIGKAAYRRELISNQSARCIAAYVYASSGVGESSTDVVFGGHALIAENGTILAEEPRFQRNATLTIADVDLQRLSIYRAQTTSFHDALLDPTLRRTYRRLSLTLGERRPHLPLRRFIDPAPFVPSATKELRERCEEIFQVQVAGLSKRLSHVRPPSVAIGVSGGLDSTLALLVVCKTFDLLGWSRERIHALTMPGFGTTSRTKANADTLMEQLGVSGRTIDIRPLCLAEWQALGHHPFGIDIRSATVESLTDELRRLPPERRSDLVFENVQARMRTTLLMNTGFVIGTGDLSELALGWCTYNGDHMSMYNPNVSIPKTLVKFLVEWVAENEFVGTVQTTLRDILNTEISPELLPTAADGKPTQSTEGSIGPYELHDFFLYHLLRYGASPSKMLFLAEQAKFRRAYTRAELVKWLRVLLTRFFTHQFKRSCMPDGPKVGSVSLSPRGDWRMPSDAHATIWLNDLPEE